MTSSGKVRIYELSRDMGLDNKDVLDAAIQLGVAAKSHSSSISDDEAAKIRSLISKGGSAQPDAGAPAGAAPIKAILSVKKAEATPAAAPLKPAAPARPVAPSSPKPPITPAKPEIVAKPAASAKPPIVVAKPEIVAKPVTPAKPAAPAKPPVIAGKPVAAVPARPITPSPKPAAPASKPAAPVVKPAASAAKPPVIAGKPPLPKPVVIASKPPARPASAAPAPSRKPELPSRPAPGKPQLVGRPVSGAPAGTSSRPAPPAGRAPLSQRPAQPQRSGTPAPIRPGQAGGARPAAPGRPAPSPLELVGKPIRRDSAGPAGAGGNRPAAPGRPGMPTGMRKPMAPGELMQLQKPGPGRPIAQPPRRAGERTEGGAAAPGGGTGTPDLVRPTATPPAAPRRPGFRAPTAPGAAGRPRRPDWDDTAKLEALRSRTPQKQRTKVHIIGENDDALTAETGGYAG